MNLERRNKNESTNINSSVKVVADMKIVKVDDVEHMEVNE